MGRLPMTEKQQAECTIESDGTGVFVLAMRFYRLAAAVRVAEHPDKAR
jgi:hypothetical protein